MRDGRNIFNLCDSYLNLRYLNLNFIYFYHGLT